MRLRILVSLAWKSLLNRRSTAALTVVSVAVSVALLIGVDRIRTEAKASFMNTISGADLVVGARSGPLNLLLYSVFRIGDATNNIGWDSYQEIAARPEVAWTIPISLGDAHRGFRVLGTDQGYFEHYRFARDRSLTFAAGKSFAHFDEAVIGADVAQALGYTVDDEIIVSHGIGDVSFVTHDDVPFRVTGILDRTGTPVDRTVHITLAGMEAIHAEEAHAEHADGHAEHADDHDGDDHDADDHDADDHDADDHDADDRDAHDHDADDHDGDDHDGDDHDAVDHDAVDHDGDDHDGDDSDGGGHAEDDHHGQDVDDGHDSDDHSEDHEGEDHEGNDRNGDDHEGHADDHAQSTDEHDDGTEVERDHDDEAFRPDAITACIIGLKSKPQLFGLQRFINEYPAEPLMAIVPGVTLQQLWELLGTAEAALFAVSAFVIAAGLVGMLTTLLTSLAERRREMAILRSVGAGPGLVFGLLLAEAVILAAAAAALGVIAVHAGMLAARPIVLERLGFYLAAGAPGMFDLVIVLAVTAAAALIATVPAWQAYRFSLADGLTVRT